MRGTGKRMLAACATLALAACSGSFGSGEKTKSEAGVKLSEFPERVYWGDAHLHTSNSVDAFGFGVRLGPEDALRFARGEEVTRFFNSACLSGSIFIFSTTSLAKAKFKSALAFCSPIPRERK